MKKTILRLLNKSPQGEVVLSLGGAIYSSLSGDVLSYFVRSVSSQLLFLEIGYKCQWLQPGKQRQQFLWLSHTTQPCRFEAVEEQEWQLVTVDS